MLSRTPHLQTTTYKVSSRITLYHGGRHGWLPTKIRHRGHQQQQQQQQQQQHLQVTCNSVRGHPGKLMHQHERSKRPARRSHIICTASVAELLSDIEALKATTEALETELQVVSQTAEAAAKRSRRLADRSHQLQEYALEHVLLGDEPSARAALVQKAAVADALAAATRRAETNIALARKLEEVLTAKQAQMLALIRLAKQQDSASSITGGPSRLSFPAASGPEHQYTRQADGSRSEGSRDVQQATQRGAGAASVAWSSPSMHASSDGWDHNERLEV